MGDMKDGFAHTGMEGTGGAEVPAADLDDVPESVRARETFFDSAEVGLCWSGEEALGSPGSADSLLKPRDRRRAGDCFVGDGGVGVFSSSRSTPSSSSAKMGGGAPRKVPVGEAGALATILPSSFMSVLVDMSGVELIRLGLTLRSDPALSSEPVSVPSSDKASEGPARGEERSGRDSRRVEADNGDGAR